MIYPLKKAGSTSYNVIALTIGTDTRILAVSSDNWITSIPSIDFSDMISFTENPVLVFSDDPANYPTVHYDGSSATLVDTPINYISNVRQPAIHSFAFPSTATNNPTTRTSYFGKSTYTAITSAYGSYNSINRYAWWKSKLTDMYLDIIGTTSTGLTAQWVAHLEVYITRGSTPASENDFLNAQGDAQIYLKKVITSFTDTGPWGDWVQDKRFTSTVYDGGNFGDLFNYNAGGVVTMSQT